MIEVDPGLKVGEEAAVSESRRWKVIENRRWWFGKQVHLICLYPAHCVKSGLFSVAPVKCAVKCAKDESKAFSFPVLSKPSSEFPHLSPIFTLELVPRSVVKLGCKATEPEKLPIGPWHR